MNKFFKCKTSFPRNNPIIKICVHCLYCIIYVIATCNHSAFADQKEDNILLSIVPILASKSPPPRPPPPPPEDLTVRIYVAGESVEEQNNYNHLPFLEDGTLNNRGAENNTTEEFGWMVPFTERLKIRAPSLTIKWVGSGCWIDHDYNCSNGKYTNSSIGQTSAMSGSTVADWLANYGAELTNKEFCYDVAFASRGGNDLNNGISKTLYAQQLEQLIFMLDQGSNCSTHPIIYVTAHLLDVAGWSYNSTQQDIDKWMGAQNKYYVKIGQDLANELNNKNGMIVRFIDMWTPFHDNKATTAFPSESWWTTDPGTGVSIPDLAKIHHDGEQHPRRLASIFAGENAANQININDFK